MNRDDLPARDKAVDRKSMPFREGTAASFVDPEPPSDAKAPMSAMSALALFMLCDGLLVGLILVFSFSGLPFAGVFITVAVVGFIGTVVAVCVRLVWNRLLASWPPHTPSAGTSWKRFRSFRVGIMNLGCCVHVARDSKALHLRLIAPMRWAGAVDASIPWGVVEAGRKSDRHIKLGKTSVYGPAWAFQPPRSPH